MKAPDKIYITTHNGETISSKWTTIPFRDFENTEYIRKDTLMDYFHQRVEELNSPLNGVSGVPRGIIVMKEFRNCSC